MIKSIVICFLCVACYLVGLNLLHLDLKTGKEWAGYGFLILGGWIGGRFG